jgi:hypothetical protein
MITFTLPSLLACAESDLAGFDTAPTEEVLSLDGDELHLGPTPTGYAGTLFGEDERPVRFEVTEGPTMPPEQRRGDRAEMDHEHDVRFLDLEGRTFVAESGGSSFVNEAWLDELEAASTVPIDAADRQADLRRLAALGELLRVAAHEGTIADDPLAIVANSAALASAEAEIDPDDDDSHPDVGAAPPATTYRHKAHIYVGSVAFTIGGKTYYGEHSAMKVNIYDDSGTYLAKYTTSNHGSGPGDSSMVESCHVSYKGRSSSTPQLWDKACDRYTSYGFGPGNHVCNDDTELEWYNVKKDKDTGNDTTCYLFSIVAPGCS